VVEVVLLIYQIMAKEEDQMEMMVEMGEMVLRYLFLAIIIMVQEAAEAQVIVVKVIGRRLQEILLVQEVKKVEVAEEREHLQKVLTDNSILEVEEAEHLIQNPEMVVLVLQL
jgi:hypothetical protein